MRGEVVYLCCLYLRDERIDGDFIHGSRCRARGECLNVGGDGEVLMLSRVI